MRKSAATELIVKSLSKHPYLWAFALCLLTDPLFLGAVENIPTAAIAVELLMVLTAAGLLGVRRAKEKKLSAAKACSVTVSLSALAVLTLPLYIASDNKAVWHFIGGIVLITILCLCADRSRFKRQLSSLFIIGTGFALKLCYVLITPIYIRQHDVDHFGGEIGHCGYIDYLLYNHKLPDFDIRERWQFCHPPLHHAISAVWIYINDSIFGVETDHARESLQTLTLFYSMCIIISAYRILRHFRLRGRALYIPLLIVSFHPAFILLSGSINNDVLSVAFMMGAVVTALRWYRHQRLWDIVKTALCIGLGMMTKVSAAAVAVPIGLLFLIVFIKKIKTDLKKLIVQFAVFALICFPLGLWFGIRNNIKWDMPLTYVQPMSEEALQYIGDMDFSDRVTDFSPELFSDVYQQWAERNEDGTVTGYNEYNPLISALKTSVFEESIHEDKFREGHTPIIASKILFWSGAALAAAAFIAMLYVCIRPKIIRPAERVFIGSFYVTLMFGFYKLAYDNPFTCSMNFRYITPTVVIGSLSIGLLIKTLRRRKLAGQVFGLMSIVFALSTAAVYMSLK